VTDHKGYVDWPQANLVNGVRLEQFERDLRQGDGSELRLKFCAVHSSAALAVNCFAPFKDRPEDLFLLGEHGAFGIQFEKQMPIIPGRRPSNLDVWVDRGSSKVAIESKLLEYFEPKKPEFAEAEARGYFSTKRAFFPRLQRTRQNNVGQRPIWKKFRKQYCSLRNCA
jgi:hypothetical protein